MVTYIPEEYQPVPKFLRELAIYDNENILDGFMVYNYMANEIEKKRLSRLGYYTISFRMLLKQNCTCKENPDV